jgi:uncharacterized protein YgiB involved in biofilm formation
MTSRRRSSVRVSLVLAGMTGLAGCGPSDPRSEYRRDVYTSIADCKADWKRDEMCQAAPPGSSPVASTPGGTYFYGPRYSWNRDWDPPARSVPASLAPTGSHAIGAVSVERGGFGLSSLFHSSGG